MKFLDKLALKIFSLIILVTIVVICLLFAGIISTNDIANVFSQVTSFSNSMEVIICVGVVLVLLALKGLFFTSKSLEQKGKDGIILENGNGKLVISKESLENLIASVTREIPGADTISSKTIVDKDRNLIVYVTAVVSKDVMIKEVSNELQARVKEAMKNTADLEVKEVNIKIKNITSKKVKGLPSPQVKEDEESSEVAETETTEVENTENENSSQE